jgi:Domain of unknown function (DUF5666)
MKIRFVSAFALGFALCAATYAQDAPAAPQQNQNQNSGSGAGAGWGQRGGRGMGMGRGVQGTVTEVAADHYTVKTFSGETYTVHFSANTRMIKQPAGMRGGRGQGQGGNGEGGGQGWRGGNPPQQIKATDIKVGDAVAASGDVDANAKSVGAMYVVLMDPERAKQMEQMEADYGKTWLMGKVTAIDGVKVTLTGPENAAHSFVADENTTFRKRRDPITLGDIQVGDMVRADGAVKNGAFTATTVSVMGGQGETRVPRDGQAPADNPPNPPVPQ